MESVKQVRKEIWNTYATTGYTHDVAQDQASAGGVHCHQIRRTRNGYWQKRIMQSNGRHIAYSPVVAIGEAEGEELFARAKTY